MGDWMRRYWKSRVGFGVLVLFLASLFQSCTELKRSMWGITTPAEVRTIRPSAYDKHSQYAEYMFTDGTRQLIVAKQTLKRSDRKLVDGELVEVIYLASNPDQAILVDSRSMMWPVVLLIMVAVFTIWLVVLMKQAMAGKGM